MAGANGVWTRSEKQRELNGCTAGELHSCQGHEDTNVGTQVSSQWLDKT